MNFFSGLFGKSRTTAPTMKLIDRGEYLVWERDGRSTGMTVTCCNGLRVYPTGKMIWEDSGEAIGEAVKVDIFGDMIAYLNREGDSPTVVIDADDPMKTRWEAYCDDHASLIAGIERTSGKSQQRAEYEGHLEWLDTGKKLSINGTDIRTVEDLNEFYRDQGCAWIS